MDNIHAEPALPPAEANLGVLVPVPTWRMRDVPWIGGMALVSLSRGLSQFTDFETRGVLPEPLDVVNHVGNTAATFVLANSVANGYWGKHPEAVTPKEYERKRKLLALGLGVFTVVANVIAEKVGYGKASTPDILDFCYGCLGGVLAYRAKKPNYIEPEIVRRGLDILEPDDPFVLMMKRALAKKQQGKSQVNIGGNIQQKGQKVANTPRSSAPKRVKRNNSRAKIQKNSRKQNRNRK